MALGTTTAIGNWNVQENCVERLTDNIPYTSANPDDALVMVGPPRYSQSQNDSDLYPVGLLQQFTFSQSRQVAPMQTIGSGRAYFTTGKSMVQFNIGRLFAKGPNLLKALYKNAEKAGVDLSKFGERPISSSASDFAINLDSELFLIPFGLQVIFRDKANNNLGAVYLENCMINSYNMGLAAGQNVMMENVAGLSDRLFSVESGKGLRGGFPTGATQVGGSLDSAALTDRVFGADNDGLQQANN